MTRTLNPIRFGLNPRDIPFPELPAQVRAAEEAASGLAGLVGTPEHILETVQEYAEAGIDAFHLFFRGADVLEQVR